jgi:hypothetical protein
MEADMSAVDMVDPNGTLTINVGKDDFDAMVDVGYGRMQGSRTIASSVGFSGAKVEMNQQGKQKITNAIGSYLEAAGFDPKQKISNMPEEKRETHVFNVATATTPLRVIADAAGGIGEDKNQIKIRYTFSLPGEAAEYNDGTRTITITSLAFARDNTYLATTIAHELIHAYDHFVGHYQSWGVKPGTMPESARAMTEVRAYQMQRWFSGGKFINPEDQKWYNYYYNQAKKLDTNYNFIIKDYSKFFDNIQK